MWGIEDPWIVLVYVLCVLSTLFCVAYGAWAWNAGDDASPAPEDETWARDEDRLIEKL